VILDVDLVVSGRDELLGLQVSRETCSDHGHEQR
jgi:hypothetical protein